MTNGNRFCHYLYEASLGPKNRANLSDLTQKYATKVRYLTIPLSYQGRRCDIEKILFVEKTLIGDIDMYDFFAENKVDETGAHIVHKDCCPSLPAKEELRWIGVRSTTAVPLREASNWFGKSAPCPECMG